MKKIMWGVISLISVIFIIGGCSHKGKGKTKDDYKNYKTYSFADDFTYKAPADWTFDDSNKENFFHYKNKDVHSDGMLNVMCVYDAGGLVSDEYSFDTWIEGVKSGEDYAGEISISTIKVDGLDAKRYSHRLKIENQIYYIDNVVFNCANGWGYIGILTLHKGDYKNVFDKVIGSINITEHVESNTETTTASTTESNTENTTEVTTEATTERQITAGERNALDKAYKYLNSSAFSKSGLMEQLEYEGFTKSEAKYAVNNCGANWKEQASKKAAQYLRSQSFSRSGLIEQLEYEGFTSKQARYGVKKAYK